MNHRNSFEVSEVVQHEQKENDFNISMAVAGSIINIAQSPQLQSYLIGQVARAAAIYRVNEIIVYDDSGGNSTRECHFMAHILESLECPQYLRKRLYPISEDFKFVGVISPLGMPHHLLVDDILPYREGIVLDKVSKTGKSYVYVGLSTDMKIDRELKPGIRVTVKITHFSENNLKGKVVSPSTPRTECGLYWGYSVRVAKSLRAVFEECPFPDGYDFKIGTSDKGVSYQNVKAKPFSRVLVVFGGVEGLEVALKNEPSLNVDNPNELFDYYINTCPYQGSKTIRAEEAILISLAKLETYFIKCLKKSKKEEL